MTSERQTSRGRFHVADPACPATRKEAVERTDALRLKARPPLHSAP